MTIPELKAEITKVTTRNDNLIKQVLDIVQDVQELRRQLGVERSPKVSSLIKETHATD